MRKKSLLSVVLGVMTFGLAQSTMAVEDGSLSTTRVVLLKNGQPQSLGTGFFYMRPEPDGKVILFLVTNHHVLTGWAPGEHKPPLGDEITLACHKDLSRPQDIAEYHVPLYGPNRLPRWLSSSSALDADIAVLPLPPTVAAACKVMALSPTQNSMAVSPFLRPSSPVTLIGYPYDFFDQHNQLPVWKTGALASEPSTDFGGRPVILIDVSAFPGMSGSPVFAVENGVHEEAEHVYAPGGRISFIGIFSAMRTLEQTKLVETLQAAPRFGVKVQQSLQLGYVWKERLIREIVQSFDASKYTN